MRRRKGSDEERKPRPVASLTPSISAYNWPPEMLRAVHTQEEHPWIAKSV